MIEGTFIWRRAWVIFDLRTYSVHSLWLPEHTAHFWNITIYELIYTNIQRSFLIFRIRQRYYSNTRHLTDVVRSVYSCGLLFSIVICSRNNKCWQYRVPSILYTRYVWEVTSKEKYRMFHKDSVSKRIAISCISYFVLIYREKCFLLVWLEMTFSLKN